jgi:DNA-binding NarL/FixJ family response regulator
VDDFAPFRCFVLSTLQKQPEFQIIGEASDGLEAVQKAEDLQPDLILLDISLPSLSGSAAARLMLKLSPKAKVLFLSENRSSEITKATLRAGAVGYVVKSDAASELLPTVEAVLHCKQFVSAKLHKKDDLHGCSIHPATR